MSTTASRPAAAAAMASPSSRVDASGASHNTSLPAANAASAIARCRDGRVAMSTRSTSGSAHSASNPTCACGTSNFAATASAVSRCAVATATSSITPAAANSA